MAFTRRHFAPQRNLSSSQTCLATKSEPCLSNLKNQSPLSHHHLPTFSVNFASDLNEPRRSQEDGVRFMLFRECDIRGRKLLYDTAATSNRHNRKTLQLMEDMVFGSAALTFHGDTVKLHDFAHEHWEGHCLMLTKIFLAQPVTLPAQFRMDPPRMSQGVSCATDSGFTDRSSFLSSLSSLAASSTNLSSASVTCESSSSLLAPKGGPALKAASDSLLPQRGGSKGKSKKLRLAFSLLFKPQACSNSEADFRDLILHHFSLVELFLTRLQFRVLQAFYRGPQCVALLDAAFQDFLQNCTNVWSLPSLNQPAWLSLMSHSDVADRFLASFTSLAALFDTKFSQFFFSSLLTAVLTHHITWVHSFVTGKSQPASCRNRILLLSRDSHRAGQFISVLSYFIRCPDALQLYGDVIASRCVNREDIPRLKKTSSSSMEIRNSAVAAIDSRNYRLADAFLDCGSPCSGHNSADLSAAAATNGNHLPRRRSQQPENLRYLKDYFDARYAAEKSHICQEDFGSFKNALMRGSFQELSSYAKLMESKESDPSSCGSPNFFVGSIPESVSESRQSGLKTAAESKRVEVPLNAVLIDGHRRKNEFYWRWHYGNGCTHGYVAGRTLQALDSRHTDWLDEVRLDLCVAACLEGSASCLIANVDTCEIQVLTCESGGPELPLRLKEHWTAVSMSGAVSSLVESTQMMWQLSNQSSLQCIDYVESRLQRLVQKSEELSHMVTRSVNAWTVQRLTGLLGVEEQDLPLLLAACSVHSPHITRMVGLSSV